MLLYSPPLRFGCALGSAVSPCRAEAPRAPAAHFQSLDLHVFLLTGAAVFCAQRLGGRSGRHISRSRVARRLRVFGISDVHTDWPENFDQLRDLPVGPYSEDALLLAGDVSHDLSRVLSTLELLKQRFGHVFFVPGNHDVYVSQDSMNSMEKHQRLLEECAQLQVWTSPVRFQEEGLLIVPLFSWYHPEFDQEPEVAAAFWPSRRHSRLALLGDEMECRWPQPLPSGAGANAAAARNMALAKIFDAMNDSREVVNLGAQPLDAEVPEQVISMSHFLPQPFLLPEKRFLFFPQLAQAAGSLFLQKRLERLKPQIHLFGHTHFAWDQRQEGVRYVSAPLGSPKEWRSRPRSMRLEGGVPTLLWRGRSSTEPFPARRRALWSDYYAQEPRCVDGDLGHWLQPRRARRLRKVAALGPTKSNAGVATLVLVWDLLAATEEQWRLLSSEEQLRARSFESGAAQQRFVTMRAALRAVLAERLGVSPWELHFQYGSHGKPELNAPWARQRFSFSVSHSGEVGAILLLEMSEQGPKTFASPAAVGVDLEERRQRPFLRLAQRYFTETEAKMLENEEKVAEKFFDMWTKKEAWLKTLGTGLSGGLASLDTVAGGDIETTSQDLRDPDLRYVVSTLTARR